MNETKRQARFARWEAIGLDEIKADLLEGGHRIIGGSPEVRGLAREWVRMKEEELRPKEPPKEMVQLKPSLYGVGIDLKEASRRLWRIVKPVRKP